MNKEAQSLGLKKSNFASAHGMYVEENYSTAHDMAKLC
jgi:D-alanyl-D-alanine carboxypeptidase